MSYTNEEIRAFLLKAIEAFSNKEYKTALVILRDILKNNPDSADAHRNIGAILMHSPSQKEALFHLQKAVELVPGNAENRMALGRFYVHIQTYDKALNVFEQVLEITGNTFQVWREIMLVHAARADYSKALEIALQLLKSAPDNTVLLLNYANILAESGRREDALVQYRALVESERSGISIETVQKWFDLMTEYHFISEARSYLKSLVENNPDNVQVMILYARSCEVDQDDIETLEVYQKAEKIAPDELMVLFGLGISYMRTGHMEKAEQTLYKLLESHPHHIPTLFALSSMHYFEENDMLFQRLKLAQEQMNQLAVPRQAELNYALGKAFDDIGNLSVAFEHYRQGGLLQAGGVFDSDYQALVRQNTRTKSIMTRDFFDMHIKEGYLDNKPLFIIGMPRSGTSLLEQVLTSFENVFGAGEINYLYDVLNDMEVADYKLDFGRLKSPFHEISTPSLLMRGKRFVEKMKSLAPADSKYIIDKTPGNFIWLGYLHLILPNARFIHARRHPVETCLSAYRIHFSDGHYWSCDLRTMGRYYRIYYEMMKHWKKVLPEGVMMEVRYEDMVTDLEPQSKDLAAFLDVDWSPECLEFHKNKRAVRTASVAQVRKPLYKSSVDRWRKYETYLQPLLDEIGDIVEEYEAE